MKSQVYSIIHTNLKARYIQCDEFAFIMSLAILADLNVLFYGTGGYGKSDQIRTVLNSLEASHSIIELHPDSRVADLFGGSVAETTVYPGSPKKTKQVEVTRESFLHSSGLCGSPYFFLEEAGDGDNAVVAALKAVITNQQFAGQTSVNRCIFGATNVTPKEMLASIPFAGDKRSFEALLQRFLTIPHGWTKHEATDYLELLDKMVSRQESLDVECIISDDLLFAEQESVSKVNIPSDVLLSLAIGAEAIPKIYKNKEPLVPRAIGIAIKLLKTYAFLQGQKTVTDEHWDVFKYSEMLSPLLDFDVQRYIAAARKDFAYKLVSERARKAIYESENLPPEQIIVEYGSIIDDLNSFAVGDAVFPVREQLTKQLTSAIDGAKAYQKFAQSNNKVK